MYARKQTQTSFSSNGVSCSLTLYPTPAIWSKPKVYLPLSFCDSSSTDTSLHVLSLSTSSHIKELRITRGSFPDYSMLPLIFSLRFKKKNYFYFICLACMYVCVLSTWCLWKLKEDPGGPGTGITDGCESENQAQVLQKSS